MSYHSLIEASLREGISLREMMLEQASVIEAGGKLWIETIKSGKTIYFAGNGGSAADAQHMAAELVGRFERYNGYPAVALTVDTSILTAISNDFGFDEVYSRQLQALAKPGDLLVATSTSGNSSNIISAAKMAKTIGLKLIGLTGSNPSKLSELCLVCLKVPSLRTCRIQEIHLTVGHIWCEMVEQALSPAAKVGADHKAIN